MTRYQWRHWGTALGDTTQGGDTLMKVKKLRLNFTKGTVETIEGGERVGGIEWWKNRMTSSSVTAPGDTSPSDATAR